MEITRYNYKELIKNDSFKSTLLDIKDGIIQDSDFDFDKLCIADELEVVLCTDDSDYDFFNSDDNKFILVGRKEDDVVGFLSYDIYEDTVCFLADESELYINNAYRNKYYATMLISKAIDEIKQQGYSKIRVNSAFELVFTILDSLAKKQIIKKYSYNGASEYEIDEQGVELYNYNVDKENIDEIVVYI